MCMRFGTWDIRSLCRTGSLKTEASELTKYNFGLVAVQEVRWNSSHSEPADVYIYILWKWEC